MLAIKSGLYTFIHRKHIYVYLQIHHDQAGFIAGMQSTFKSEEILNLISLLYSLEDLKRKSI